MQLSVDQGGGWIDRLAWLLPVRFLPGSSFLHHRIFFFFQSDHGLHFPYIFFRLCCFETGSPVHTSNLLCSVVEDDLNSWASCLSVLRAGIIGEYHYNQPSFVLFLIFVYLVFLMFIYLVEASRPVLSFHQVVSGDQTQVVWSWWQCGFAMNLLISFFFSPTPE